MSVGEYRPQVFVYMSTGKWGKRVWLLVYSEVVTLAGKCMTTSSSTGDVVEQAML